MENLIGKKLEKREVFALFAMNAILDNLDRWPIQMQKENPEFCKQMAQSAILCADSLIAELEKVGN